MMESQKQSAPVRGAFLIAVASSMMAVGGLLIQTQTRYLPDSMIVFIFFAAGCAVALPMALWKKVLFARNIPIALQVTRSLVGVGQITIFFLSLRTLPLVDSVLLRATAPIWVPILMVLLYRQPIDGRTFLYICIGFFGVALILHPVESKLTIGYPLAIGAGILYGLQNILSRRLDELNEPVLRTSAIVFTIGFILSAIGATLDWQTPTPSSIAILGLVGVSLLGVTSLIIFSLKFAPATILTPFLYVAVIVSAGLDWAVFNRVPTASTIVGCLIVIAVCVLLGSRTHSTGAHST